MKSTWTGAMLLAVAGLFSAAGNAAGHQELRIATEAGYPPFEYRNANGQLEGFDIDIGNALCARLRRTCVWIDQAFDSLIPGLQAKKFDLVDSTLTITEARQAVIDFTIPLYSVPVKLMVKKGSGLEPFAKSLKGRRVGVQQGTTMEAYAREHWAPHGVRVISYANYTSAYVDVTAGRLDATFQEAQGALESFLNKPEGASYELVPVILKDPLLNQPIALGMRKGNPLKADVDKTLEAMLADGTIQQLAGKYFAEGNIQFPPP